MPVPHPADKSDANTLPDPELNPLLNPLLAAHMGRWAEVYFTNPPEKRGQAVSELLRELENASPPEPAYVQRTADEGARKNTETAESPISSPSPLDPVLTCSECAQSNSAGHRFCGMCGAPLEVPQKAHLRRLAEAAPIPGGSWLERSLGGKSVEDTIEPAVSSTAASPRGDARGLTWLLPEKNLPHLGVESRPLHRSYRKPVYIGAALAILLTLLGYVTWRGTEAPAGAAASRSAPAISHAQPAPVNSVQAPRATASALPTPPPAPRIQKQNQPDTYSRKDQAIDSQPAAGTVPVDASSSAGAAAQSGAEELAMAEKYLNGSPGVARDSGEAAQWLWKAVRKRNLEATLALSDLYLRGDGVPRSCDQARLLLEAAARKGGKAAAERLRNLQAFGCQ
jgi:hypothetical protein